MRKDPANPIVTSNPGVSNERHNPDHLKPQYYYPDSAPAEIRAWELCETPDGEVYLVAHLRPGLLYRSCACTLGRETALQKMQWTEDGWLRMADGSNLAKITVPESALPQCPLPGIPEFDDFDAPSLGNWYYAPRMMPQTFADVTARGYVRLRGQEARTSLNRVSILARKLTSLHVRITTKMEFHPVVYQHSAGLILYYDNMNYINLRKYYSENAGTGKRFPLFIWKMG